MGHLFLDIETYISATNLDSANNPYHNDSKILAIAYNHYDTFRPPVKSEIKAPVLLKEWEFGEKAMLTAFFGKLTALLEKDPNLKIHGFNILKFDLPYLFGRMMKHGVASEKDLHALFFQRHGTDMMHLAGMLSDETRAKEQLWGISKNDANQFFGHQAVEGIGLEASLHYDRKEFEKLEERMMREFNFEQLMNSFYLYAKRLSDGKELVN